MMTLPALLRAAAAGLCLAALASCTTASMDALDLTRGYANPPLLSSFKAVEHEDYPIHGIDVSKYQGEIDWEAAKRGGVAFAFIKATEGGDMIDPRFMENWKAAKAAGVPRAAYHFFYHCRPAIEQAEWFIEHVPNDPTALPPILDVEWTPFSPTCTRRPPRDELIREMRIFLNALEEHYGVRPILYIPIDVHRDRLVGAFPDYDFWLRSVADHPDNVYEDRDYLFWQWTASGTVPGVQGEVDRNAFAGTREDWRRWVAFHTGQAGF